MRELFSFIFGKITDPLTLPLSPLYEWLILAVIGLVAFILAYRLVGDMYDVGFIDGGLLGSIFHWIIRIIFFAAIWALTYAVIVAGQWVMAHWLLTVCVAGGLVLIGVTAYFIIRHHNQEAWA